MNIPLNFIILPSEEFFIRLFKNVNNFYEIFVKITIFFTNVKK